MINKKDILPDIMEFKLERYDCLSEKRGKDINGIFKKRLIAYISENLIKISNSESYIFATEEALKLMLHINTFEDYKFDINNKYCLTAYKLLLRAIKDFEEVRDVFAFCTEKYDGSLKIKCLSNGAIFPADKIQIDAIRNYMKYNTLESRQYSLVIQSDIKPYVSFREVLFSYSIEQILEEFQDKFEFCTARAEEKYYDKFRKMYNKLKERKITNDLCRNLSIYLVSDEITEEEEICVEENTNTIIANKELDLDDWLNADIKDYDIYKCTLCLKEIVDIKCYNKKSEKKIINDYLNFDNYYNLGYFDNFCDDDYEDSDDIYYENLINMYEK